MPISALARRDEALLALVFLTRLPLGRFLPARILPLARAVWAFPLVGALIGAIAALPLCLPGPAGLQAALSVALSLWLTGALHEDGLADLADATGGRDREDKLRIMRDSRIGSYGTLALIATTALRIAALGVLGPVHLIVAAASGRVAIALMMATLPPARGDGLGQGAGRPGRGNVALAVLLGAGALLACGAAGIGAALAGICVILALRAWARRWLGGQTGDVLGSASVLAETTILVAFALFSGA